MYILDINMWFTKLIKQFFFWIDKIVYNFISSIYDLMITIARTSPLTQADIADMAKRIYMLLAVFMIFKVTLSLITYVVNPDDFSDKSKGVSKLGTNIVISLALLVLTPYIFNYAYQLQTIILEDNSLATLIFGETEEGKINTSFFNTAGDDIAFMTMSAFLSPNLSLNEGTYDLSDCVNLFEKENDEIKFDDTCYLAMQHFVGGGGYEQTTLDNYVAAVENNNLGLLLRQDLVLAVEPDTPNGDVFIMDYKFIFSTVVGVVVVLLLLTFCMDVALRSIKLSFLQLIAPIPILSYVDPKSGKDGMFKKWYEMCFKTYLSLFIRLLALYFAVFIISKVADMKMVDLVDGSYQTNSLVGILIIIGALMFAKQLPKMLEGLGIKLDGDGKFFLNPLKKFEEQAFAGKNITGAARGAVTGLAGAFSGAGWSRGITGAWRGMTSGKGWKETGKAEAEMNRKMRQAKLDGSTFGGRLGARFSGALGLESSGEKITAKDKALEKQIKKQEDFHKSFEAIKSQVSGAIEGQKLGSYSNKYNELRAKVEAAKIMKDSIKREDFSDDAAYEAEVERVSKALIDAENKVSRYLKKEAIEDYYNAFRAGRLADSEKISEIVNVFKQYDAEAVANGESIPTTYSSAKKKDEDVSIKINELQNERIRIRDERVKAEADQNAIK